MILRKIKVCLLFMPGITLLVFSTMAFVNHQSQNSPPEVLIISPSANSAFRWNSPIRYAIQVTDKEDGDSRYDEINTNEVLLRVLYLQDSSHVFEYSDTKMEEEPKAITLIKTSTCFNCHSNKNKLIGPSFSQIADKYGNSKESISTLVGKVINGSVGIWGDVPMPSNTDLSTDEIQTIIKWLLETGNDPNVFYQRGLTGTFVLKEEQYKRENQRGVFVLTASYLDQGFGNNQSAKRQGQHSIVIKPFN
ncbi:MAG: hypothetical protein JNM78_11795 [Cyclobacteriaceae bacterium]|nr:hypothetical protein [Cyclobacteriaceae bacterium]